MAVKQIYACFNRSVTPIQLISLQPIVYKAEDITFEESHQIKLNRLGLQTVRESQFYNCETWQASDAEDKIVQLHLPQEPENYEFGLYVRTEAGEEKEFGNLMGLRATFSF